MTVALLRGEVSARSSLCGDWRTASARQRSAILAGQTDRAWRLHAVSIALVPWHEHVAVCALISLLPGHGRASHVLADLCRWADCARVVLELTPTGTPGSDVDRVASWYAAYGWAPNWEVPRPGLPKQTMIRYPIPARGHGHCRL